MNVELNISKKLARCWDSLLWNECSAVQNEYKAEYFGYIFFLWHE